MLFVSGTKRSGTSMWMQVLVAAGVPVLGKAFPRNWEHASLKEANPDGFYESILRQGIYFRTNPHPATGQYFMPEHVKGYAVKVFVPGVVRSERAYIDLLVANIREWREYEASINRLYDLEDRDRLAKTPDAEPPFRFPPALEWWMENFALVRDISLRRYPYQLQTYHQVVTEPERIITRVLERFGGDVDIAKGVAAVKPENRTQEAVRSDSVEPELAEVFDELYATIRDSRGLTGAFLQTLNATNRRMLPTLTELQTKVVRSMAKHGGRARPMGVEGLPELG
jgi:hypothetical protein